MEVFDVFYGKEAAGTVLLKKEGLYYNLSCHCKLIEGLLRLVAYGEHDTVPIGICAPEGTGIGICRKLSAKRLGPPPWRFALLDVKPEVFVPLGGELPTVVLQNLEKARFCTRDGMPGLLFSYLPEL